MVERPKRSPIGLYTSLETLNFEKQELSNHCPGCKVKDIEELLELEIFFESNPGVPRAESVHTEVSWP